MSLLNGCRAFLYSMETSFQNFLERLTSAYIKEIESFLELVKSIEVNLINFSGNQQAWRAQFLFFKGFLLMLEEISLFGGGGGAEWALDYNSIKFWGFPNILYFPKILSFGNSLDNLYIPCLILIITFRFTCGERKICQTSKIPKYYDHDCR